MKFRFRICVFNRIFVNLAAAYRSFKALESTDADDHKQWLAFWVNIVGGFILYARMSILFYRVSRLICPFLDYYCRLSKF